MIKLFDSLNPATQWSKFFSQEVNLGTRKKKDNQKSFSSYQIFVYLIMICCLPTIITTYKSVLLQLGTIKSQSLEYSGNTELKYDIETLPELLPIHYFAFFHADDIENRILCEYY